MMFFRPLIACVAALQLTGAALPALAEAPAAADPGRELALYLTHHGYGVVRVDSSAGENRELLTANINGQWQTMLVDTGCDASVLTWYAARDLGLNVVMTKEVAVGVGGILKKNGIAAVKSFKLNNYEINRTSLIHVMSPDAHIAENGLFGLDFMKLNAVVLPVGATFFFFKPGATPVADIGPYMKTMGYKAVPLSYGAGGLRVEGTLDGHPYSAVVDSGNTFTFFDANYVRNTVGAFPRGVPLYGVGIDGRRVPRTLFDTRQLTVGAISFGSIEMSAQDHSYLERLKAQALLGYDLLAEHQAIVDLGNNVLWMK